jgi:S-formylglutathione hydrolase FrmB
MRHAFTLISIVALSLRAVAGAAVPPRRVTVHRPTAVVAGSVHEDQFFSSALGVNKHLVVYLPPSYGVRSARRYPVAYYLHGLSGSEADWVSKGAIDGAADSLFAAGVPEMIIVMPDGDDGWYTNWTAEVPYATCADTLHGEAPDRYCAEHERYDDYVAHDVVAYVDAHYRTLKARAHRGIGGLSMGGYGALALALRHPDVFAAAASHSGVVSPMYVGPHPFAEPAHFAGSNTDEMRLAAASFFPRYLLYWGAAIERWRDADPAVLAERATQRGTVLPALFLDCGASDGLLDQNRALHAALTRLGVTHAYAEWPGAHTWRYWSTHVRESLAWMARRIA